MYWKEKSKEPGLTENFIEKHSDKVRGLIRKSEWKRRQSAPSIKITSKAFGSGRRIPL